MQKIKYTFIYIVLSGMFFSGCAKIGSPDGGPRDETPPHVVNSKPENYSTHFDEDRVEITFNEFVELKDVYTDFFVSPPLEEKPIPRIRSKSVVVDIDSEELDSTTYTLSFGNSIVDITEGNPVRLFEFVFSTTDHIDSMAVHGRLVDGFNHSPDEERYCVCLYKNTFDSVPYLQEPDYLGYTDDEGVFRINNLPHGVYKLFALKDGNGNLIYDLPNEAIAFADEFIHLTTDSFYIDGALPDTIPEYPENATSQDSLYADSLLHDRLNYTMHYDLYSFTEESRTQFLNDYKRPNPKKINLFFELPITDSLVFKPLVDDAPDNWFLREDNPTLDSISYWITDSTLYKNDSLSFEVVYTVTDSNGFFVPKQDTLLFYTATKKKERKRQSRRLKEVDEETAADSVKVIIPTIGLKSNINSSSPFDLNKSVNIVCQTPVDDFDPSKFEYYKMEDTIEVKQTFTIRQDTLLNRRFILNTKFEERFNYIVRVFPGAITDIYGLTNDTIEYSFATQRADYYGLLYVNVSGIQEQILVQLLDQEERVIREKIIQSDQVVTFDYLSPKSYKLKAIVDSNKNGEWDTGKYLKKQQPEKVHYYSGELDVRSNWDIEIAWVIR